MNNLYNGRDSGVQCRYSIDGVSGSCFPATFCFVGPSSQCGARRSGRPRRSLRPSAYPWMAHRLSWNYKAIHTTNSRDVMRQGDVMCQVCENKDLAASGMPWDAFAMQRWRKSVNACSVRVKLDKLVAGTAMHLLFPSFSRIDQDLLDEDAAQTKDIATTLMSPKDLALGLKDTCSRHTFPDAAICVRQGKPMTFSLESSARANHPTPVQTPKTPTLSKRKRCVRFAPCAVPSRVVTPPRPARARGPRLGGRTASSRKAHLEDSWVNEG